MSEKIKDKVLEFAGIAKECPENLQLKCFELLLSNYLNQLSEKVEKKAESKKDNEHAQRNDETPANNEKELIQEDILEKEIHVKARSFLKKCNLTIEHINQIFYKEGDDIKPLYDDLKTTIVAESQIRIALLQSLKQSLVMGDFQFDGESVRAETQLRKCYDAKNFTRIFKLNKDLFDNFESYDKTQPKIMLSTQGKDRLAEIIKELQ